jgi:hypothetical protein
MGNKPLLAEMSAHLLFYRIRRHPETEVTEDLSVGTAEWQEGAGRLLLLAAAHQTGLLTELQTALQPSLLAAAPTLRLAHSQPVTLRCQLLTLLFLEAVGLQRTWDLRSYTGQALALLTGRRLAYGYRQAVYADHLIPRGLVGRLEKVLGCRVKQPQGSDHDRLQGGSGS